MTVRTVKDLINEGVEGRYVPVRSDFNVPLEDSVVTDPGRVDALLPTLFALVDTGAKVVVIAYPGRPKGEVKPEFSLVPVTKALSERLERYVVLAGYVSDENAHERVNDLTEGDVLLLENTRFDPRETFKDEAERAEFAAELAALVPDGTLISDGFGVVHRAQTFVFDIAKKLPRYTGSLVQTGLKALRKVAEAPEKPYTVVLGGSKASDKLDVVEALAPKVDFLVVGDGICFAFPTAKGCAVSSSLLQEEMIDTCKDLLNRCGGRIVLPTDVVVAGKFTADTENKVVEATKTPKGWMGLSIGPASAEAFGKMLAEPRTVFWNSPMGVFEVEAFAADTREIAQAIIDATTNNGCFSIVGGGGSAAAVRTLGLNEEGFSHIFTGGGASLESLEGKTLPDASVLED